MSLLQITKTDYLNFRFCRKNLWLAKNYPNEFAKYELSEFELEIIKEGQEVDKEAQNLFPEGILISAGQDEAISKTKEIISNPQENPIIFQGAIFSEPYYIRTDVLRFDPEINGWCLSEVKATTKVKEEKFNNHIYDLAFQYNVCLLAGIEIKKLEVIHLNPLYKKSGELDYKQLFVIADVTDKVLEVADQVSAEMQLMIDYLNGPEEKYCQCRYRPRTDSNHCSTFGYSNPDVPEYAVHDVTRINKNKLQILVDDNCLDIKDIPEGFKLSDNQQIQVDAARLQKIIFDAEMIRDFLSELTYPLYFIDYESYLPAIPWFNRYSPYQNIVFQYSLHILETPDGELQHREFLATDNEEPSHLLVDSMFQDVGGEGSVIVWHKPFEMGRNKEMAILNPNYANFLEKVNDRIVDLKEIFSKGMYVDPKFKGSASIKKVLPVIVPELSYANLPINNGADANKKWGKMLKGELTESEKKETITNLLNYCKQDTLAMVKIFEFLKRF